MTDLNIYHAVSSLSRTVAGKLAASLALEHYGKQVTSDVPSSLQQEVYGSLKARSPARRLQICRYVTNGVTPGGDMVDFWYRGDPTRLETAKRAASAYATLGEMDAHSDLELPIGISTVKVRLRVSTTLSALNDLLFQIPAILDRLVAGLIREVEDQDFDDGNVSLPSMLCKLY